MREALGYVKMYPLGQRASLIPQGLPQGLAVLTSYNYAQSHRLLLYKPLGFSVSGVAGIGVLSSSLEPTSI